MYENLSDEQITVLATGSFWVLPEHAQSALVREIRRRGLPGVAGIACRPGDIDQTGAGRRQLERYRRLGFSDEEIRDLLIRIREDR